MLGHGKCLNHAGQVAELLGDVVASLSKCPDLGAGLFQECTSLGPHCVGVGSGSRQGCGRLVTNFPAVLVCLRLQTGDLRCGMFAQQLGTAFGLVEAPLCALEPCVSREVGLGDDPLGVGLGPLPRGDGVLLGRRENSTGLGSEPLGLSRGVGHCGSRTQGDAGDDVLELSSAREHAGSRGVVDRQPLLFGPGLGGGQERADCASGPVHVLGGFPQDPVRLGRRGIAQGRSLSGRGGAELGRFCPCLVEHLSSCGMRCVQVDLGARDRFVRELLGRGTNRGRLLGCLDPEPEQLCADLSFSGGESGCGLGLKLDDLRPRLLELCGGEPAQPLVLDTCFVPDLLGLRR